jgi:hypothetical protein
MKTLRQIAGGNTRRKYDVQNPPAKYWGTWTPQGKRRVVHRSDGSMSTDKTSGFHSRPAHKEQLRNANRSMNKRARQMLKQQLAQEARALVSNLLGEGMDQLQEQGQSDYERYTELMAQMKQMLAQRDFDGFYRLQKETEAIKNRNGGMPPAPPAAG